MVSVKVHLQRRQHDAWMRKDPLEIALSRREKVESPAGGWTLGPPVTLAPQLFRMTPLIRRVGRGETQSPDGPIADNQYLLYGYRNANVQKDDTFIISGERYEVNRVHPDRDVETTAVVDWKGPEDD